MSYEVRPTKRWRQNTSSKIKEAPPKERLVKIEI